MIPLGHHFILAKEAASNIGSLIMQHLIQTFETHDCVPANSGKDTRNPKRR
jgi:hypothetical protein